MPLTARAPTAGTAGVLPLAVLFAFNLVDEFDRVASAALTPEIRETFHMSDAQIGAIGVVAGLGMLVTAYPVGRLADRSSRVRLSALAAVLWASMMVVTGAATSIGLLFGARLLGGIGRGANEVVHPSLLSDFYPASRQPRVFQVHRLANPLGALGAVAAGAIGQWMGWRAAFWILAVPTMLLLLPLSRLREPARRRGAMDAALSQPVPGPGRSPSAADRRRLRALPSLRRVCLVAFFLGACFVAAPQFLSLFFDAIHGTGSVGRGAVQALFGIGVAAGLLIGGPIAQRSIDERDFQGLVRACVTGFAILAAGFWCLAATPSEAVSFAAVPLLASGIGIFQPGYFTLLAQAAPAELRSQAFATAIVFVGLGGVLGIATFGIAEHAGFRATAVLLGTFAFAATLTGRSLAALVAHDLEGVELMP